MAVQEFPNQEKLNRAFNIYGHYVREFIYEQLAAYHANAHPRYQYQAIKDAIVGSLPESQRNNFDRNLRSNNDNLKATIDIARFNQIVTMHWDAIFAEKFNNQEVIIRNGRGGRAWAHGHLGYISEFRNDSYHNLATDIDDYQLEQTIRKISEVLYLIGEREAGDAVEAILSQENDINALRQDRNQLADARDAAIKERDSAKREAERANEKAEQADERVNRIADIAHANSTENRELKETLRARQQRISQLSAEKDAAIQERDSAALALEQEKKRADEQERRIRDLEDKIKQLSP